MAGVCKEAKSLMKCFFLLRLCFLQWKFEDSISEFGVLSFSSGKFSK